MPAPEHETGVLHGRFQILHNDHMKYLLAGKALCRHLVIGITNPDPRLTAEESTDPQRSSALANPLTYYERYVLINAALKEKAINPHEFSVVPFPINLPRSYKYYVPLDAVFFVSIYDDWGRQKLDYFKSLKLTTHILREVAPEHKGVSASEIRERMIRGTPWTNMVPPGVSRLMEKWNIPDRLKTIRKSL